MPPEQCPERPDESCYQASNYMTTSNDALQEANDLLMSQVRQLRLRNRWMLDEINQSDLVASLLETYLRQLGRGDLVARAKAVANRSEP